MPPAVVSEVAEPLVGMVEEKLSAESRCRDEGIERRRVWARQTLQG